MAEISVSYENNEVDNSFYFSKPINTAYIWESLNAMVDVLRLIGFSDNLIEDWIGNTYFTEDDAPPRDWN